MSESQEGFGEVDLHLLAQRVVVLEETVEVITEYITGPNVGGPWFWPHLTEQQRRNLMSQTAEFVQWLHETYLADIARYALPSCWWRHADVRDQLIALMVAHRAVYTKKAKAASGDLVDWHERALWPVLDRIHNNHTLSSCLDGNHSAHETRHRARWDRDPALTEYLAAPQHATDSLLDIDDMEEPS